MDNATDDCLDAIYAFCDEMILLEKISVLDAICDSWGVDNLDLALGLLTATLPVRYKLPSRMLLMKRCILHHGNKKGLFDGL